MNNRASRTRAGDATAARARPVPSGNISPDRPLRPSAASPPDYPMPKQIKLHEQRHDAFLDGVGEGEPPSLQEEAQSPSHGAGTHCRSGPVLWKADAASRWQSAWRVSESTAPARRARQASVTEVCRTRSFSRDCLEYCQSSSNSSYFSFLYEGK